MATNKKRNQKRHIQDKPKVNVSTMLAREFELAKQFDVERQHVIEDSCEMYSIALAMTLHDRCDKTRTWIENCLNHIQKLCEEFTEGRLSIADCRRALINEIDLAIGDDEKYLPLETKGEGK
jgi:hypothetical protein